jgi:hypothetical protein
VDDRFEMYPKIFDDFPKIHAPFEKLGGIW